MSNSVRNFTVARHVYYKASFLPKLPLDKRRQKHDVITGAALFNFVAAYMNRVSVASLTNEFAKIAFRNLLRLGWVKSVIDQNSIRIIKK